MPQIPRHTAFLGLTFLVVFAFAGYDRWTVPSQAVPQVRCGDGLCDVTEQTSCAGDCGTRVAQAPTGARTCTDSDFGKDYSRIGTVSIMGAANASRTDFCSKNGRLVREFFCEGPDIRSVDYACPNGCAKGVCKTGSVAMHAAGGVRRCMDLQDGGKNFSLVGTVAMLDNSAPPQRDFCMTGLLQGTLAEFSCEDGLRMTRVLHRCPVDCVDGACI